MGQALIVSHQGEGQYTVKLQYSGLDGAIAQIEAQRATLEARIPQLEAALTQAEIDLTQTRQTAESLLNDWLAGMPVSGEGLAYEWSPSAMQYAQAAADAAKVPAALINALGAISKASQTAYAAEFNLDSAYAEYLSVTAREAELNRLKESSDTPVSAWCADYTLDLSGTVATLEVPGEPNPLTGGGINIKPGFFDEAAWSVDYGQLQMATILSESGFAWNLTMLMPWLKWMPKWRYGTVTAVNSDGTLDVTLDAIQSKAQAWLAHDRTFNDPWTDVMSGVIVQYMTCGAAAFDVNDPVVVQFTQKSRTQFEPVVIGFRDHPKQCNAFLVGKGGIGGYLVRSSRVTTPGAYGGGMADWQGDLGTVSWRWGGARYGAPETPGSPIYRNNAYWINAPGAVGGAALAAVGGTLTLHVMIFSTRYARAYRVNPETGASAMVAEQRLYPNTNYQAQWRIWCFSPDGMEAHTVVRNIAQPVLPIHWSFSFGSGTFVNHGYKSLPSPYPYFRENGEFGYGEDYFAADYRNNVLVFGTIYYSDVGTTSDGGQTSVKKIKINDDVFVEGSTYIVQEYTSPFVPYLLSENKNRDEISEIYVDIRDDFFVIYRYQAISQVINTVTNLPFGITNTYSLQESQIIEVYYKNNKIELEKIDFNESGEIYTNTNPPTYQGYDYNPDSYFLNYSVSGGVILTHPKEAMFTAGWQTIRPTGEPQVIALAWYSDGDIRSILGLTADQNQYPIRVV